MSATPTNFLQAGSDWLADQQKAFTSSPILYARGTDSVTVQAVIGRTPWQVETSTGMNLEEVTRDYIVQVADLVLPTAGAIVPQKGDRITETLNGESAVFEVMAPSGGTVYRWGDAFRKTYRIHTKRVAA